MGFIEKNRDTLYQDFKRLLYHSRNSVLSGMWPEGAQSITQTTKRPLTAGTLFQRSMTELVLTLQKKGKSNEALASNKSLNYLFFFVL